MQRHFHSNRFHAVAADGAVDPEHPLNKSLVALYLPGLPGTPAAGGRLLNLAGQSHGVLTAAPAWTVAKGQPGGYGGLTFNGSSNYVKVNTNFGSVRTNPLSIFCWVYFDPTSVVGWKGGFVYIGDDTGGYGIGVGNGTWDASSGSNIIALYGGIAWHDSGASFTTTGWNHIGLVMSNGSANLDFYRNGVNIASQSGLTAAISPAAATTYIGCEDGASRFFTGVIGEVRISNKAFSVSDAKNLYNVSRQGYRVPDSPLRWASTRTWFVPAGGVTFNPGWAAGATSGVIGTGAY